MMQGRSKSNFWQPFCVLPGVKQEKKHYYYMSIEHVQMYHARRKNGHSSSMYTPTYSINTS